MRAFSFAALAPRVPGANHSRRQLLAVTLALGLLWTTPFAAPSVRALEVTPTDGAIAAGIEHSCALQANGMVLCWGSNRNGELGDGTTSSDLRVTPAPVSGLSRARAVSVGWGYSCALLANGTVECWGDNRHGQLGNGTSLALSTLPTRVSNVANAVAISAGREHACALLANGTASCWGENHSGELGNGRFENSRVAVPVANLASAIQITAGVGHTCALLAGGTIKCWGGNYYGTLGNGTTADSATPVTVSGISTAVSVSAGGRHTCAALADGTVSCWGDNQYRQLADPSGVGQNTPVQIGGITDAASVSIFYNSCAVLRDGTARCWGRNDYGEVGDGTTEERTVPVSPSGLANVSSLSAQTHTCALVTDGTARCWGSRNSWIIGSESSDNVETPTTVQGFARGDGGPGNDEFANAQAIRAVPFGDRLGTAGASTQNGEPAPSCSSTAFDESVWYRYRFSVARELRFSADTDTTLAVYEGTSLGGLSERMCLAPGDGVLSLAADTTYYVQLVGAAAASSIGFSVGAANAAPNDDFAHAQAIGSLPYGSAIDATSATLEAGEPFPTCAWSTEPANSVWYRFTGGENTGIQLATSGYAARTGVYVGDSLTSLSQVACLGGDDGNRLYVPAGTTYYIQVYGMGTSGVLQFSAEEVPYDYTAPLITVPPLPEAQSERLLKNTTTRITWEGADEGSGVATYELQRRLDSGKWASARTSSETFAEVPLTLGRLQEYRVRGHDRAGNASPWLKGPAFTPRLRQQGWASVRYVSGSWSKQSTTKASGGLTRWTKSSNGVVRVSFTGRAISWVSVRGPDRGKARVYVDGLHVADVDLYAATTSWKRVVFGVSWSSVGSHTLEVRNAGSKRIDLDALVVYR